MCTRTCISSACCVCWAQHPQKFNFAGAAAFPPAQMPLCEDARTCNLCGGPVVGVPDDALDSGSGSPVHPDLSAGHQWLSHASVLKSHREFLPWQHEHPRRDPAQAAAERQRAAAEYARLAKAEEELEGPTEDDEGDWYFSPRWDDDTYTNKRFLLTPSGNLTGDKVRPCRLPRQARPGQARPD